MGEGLSLSPKFNVTDAEASIMTPPRLLFATRKVRICMIHISNINLLPNRLTIRIVIIGHGKCKGS